jgi:hypothetical protein
MWSERGENAVTCSLVLLFPGSSLLATFLFPSRASIAQEIPAASIRNWIEAPNPLRPFTILKAGLGTFGRAGIDSFLASRTAVQS